MHSPIYFERKCSGFAAQMQRIDPVSQADRSFNHFEKPSSSASVSIEI
jgi:hypothetical protein